MHALSNYFGTEFDMSTQPITANQEIEAKLIKMQTQLEGLRRLLQAGEETIPLEEFLPFSGAVGAKYFYYNFKKHYVEEGFWAGGGIDETSRLYGNVFCTMRAAETITENRITLAKLKILANFTPDWSNEDQKKFGLSWNFASESLHINDLNAISSLDVCFRTKEKAKKAANDVGHVKIRQLFQYGI